MTATPTWEVASFHGNDLPCSSQVDVKAYPTSRHLEASFAGQPVARAGDTCAVCKWSSDPGTGPVQGGRPGEAVSARAFPEVAWTLALVWFVASSCGCPWWRRNPWPPGRRKGCWLALKPWATEIENEFLQPGLGRRARERELVQGLRASLP